MGLSQTKLDINNPTPFTTHKKKKLSKRLPIHRPPSPNYDHCPHTPICYNTKYFTRTTTQGKKKQTKNQKKKKKLIASTIHTDYPWIYLHRLSTLPLPNKTTTLESYQVLYNKLLHTNNGSPLPSQLLYTVNNGAGESEGKFLQCMDKINMNDLDLSIFYIKHKVQALHIACTSFMTEIKTHRTGHKAHKLPKHSLYYSDHVQHSLHRVASFQSQKSSPHSL